MAIINFNFEYLLPDSPFATTSEKGNTATWVYEGPERLYVGVNADGKLSQRGLVDADANPGFKYRPEYTTLEFFARDFPIVASLYYINYELNPIQKKLTAFPTGIQEYINDPKPLPEIYSKEDITYNFATNTFNTPLMESDITWNVVRKQRNDELANADKLMAAEDMPEQFREAVSVYRETLRNIPADWANHHPAEVIFPDPPSF